MTMIGLLCQTRPFVVITLPEFATASIDEGKVGVTIEGKTTPFEMVYRLAIANRQGFGTTTSQGFTRKTYIIAGMMGLKVVDGLPKFNDLLAGQCKDQLPKVGV